MRNRISEYLESTTTPRGNVLAELLWHGAARALMVGDLYLHADPARHDAAIAVGADLVELARQLEDAPAPTTPREHLELASAVREAMVGAEAILRPLAPLG
jgi:hypothetical protein